MLLLACCGGGLALAFAAYDSRDYSVGDCVKEEKKSGGTDSKAVKIDCSEDGAHKVVKKLDDTTETTDCPADTTDFHFIDFSDRYVLCLQKVS